MRRPIFFQDNPFYLLEGIPLRKDIAERPTPEMGTRPRRRNNTNRGEFVLGETGKGNPQLALLSPFHIRFGDSPGRMNHGAIIHLAAFNVGIIAVLNNLDITEGVTLFLGVDFFHEKLIHFVASGVGAFSRHKLFQGGGHHIIAEANQVGVGRPDDGANPFRGHILESAVVPVAGFLNGVFPRPVNLSAKIGHFGV